MQAKLFAWTTCSVAEFMLKLPFPPPFATVRAGISQLKVSPFEIPRPSSTDIYFVLESRSLRQMGRSGRSRRLLLSVTHC